MKKDGGVMSDEFRDRLKFVQQVASREGAVIPDDAASYLARLTLDARELEGTIMRIVAYAVLMQQAITFLLVQQQTERIGIDVLPTMH
jgi:chromosomal replication initiation ATPase DnaA